MNIDNKKVHVTMKKVSFNLENWEFAKKEPLDDYGVVSLAEAYQIFADFCKKYPDATLCSEVGAFEYVEGNRQVSEDKIETYLMLYAEMPFITSYSI